jgi:hypothetical protein
MSYRDIILPAIDQETYTHWRSYSDCADPQKVIQNNPNLPIPIQHDAPAVLRGALEKIALFLTREHDYPSYHHNSCDKDQVGFLWMEDKGESIEAYGACSFEWTGFEASRKWPAGEAWRMAWVWFHPYDRRCGHLSSAWDYFCARFGKFHLLCPVSPAMARFLKKREFWLEVDEETGYIKDL